MQKSNSADNQQEIVSESEMGWLAGIIDGEGCIHIDLDPRGNAHPSITITNSNVLIIERALEIWHKIGIGARVTTRRINHPKHSPVKDVMVIGYKRLKPALIAIMPYLIGKADEALLLYRFVESRLNAPSGVTGNKAKYTDNEIRLAKAIKECKSRNKILRDYTLNCSNTDDIVRATQRCVEAGRNIQSRLISE